MAREFRLLFLLLFVVACIGQTASLAGQGNANSIQTPTSTTTTASTSIPSTTQTPTYTTTTASISIPSTTQTPTTTKTASTSSPSTTQTPTTTKTASTSIPSTTQTPTTTKTASTSIPSTTQTPTTTKTASTSSPSTTQTPTTTKTASTSSPSTTQTPTTTKTASTSSPSTTQTPTTTKTASTSSPSTTQTPTTTKTASTSSPSTTQTPTTTKTANASSPSTTQTPTTTKTASTSIPSTTQTPTTTKTANASSPSTTQTPTTTKTASTSIPSTTQTPTTTTGSGGVSTATVPATTKPPGPCESNPCGHGSTCEPRVGHTFTCLCLAGDYYNNKSNICERAKVFPGQLNLTMIYDDKMADNKSTEFKIASENITAALDDVYKDSVTGYTGSTVLELRSKEKSKFWSRSGKKVTASVEIIFKIDSDITASQVETQIKTASNFSDGVLGDATFTETSLCDKGPCDEKTTTCLSENGLFNCTCSINYIPTDFSSRVCFACPTGQKASRSECVDCPFGYSGFNCNESWKLALVIVGSVLGGLLLITLILLPVVACKSSNKSSRKSKDVDIVEPYVSHSPAKAPLVNSSLANSRAPSINNGPANGLGSFANAGAPRIPRASTASNWDRKIDLEMTPSSSRQSLIPAGRNTPLYEDTDAMNSNPYAQVRPPSSLYAQVRPQSSPYAQNRPQNNLYAQNRPQSNPYASSQGQTNPYYIHDDGRRFN